MAFNSDIGGRSFFLFYFAPYTLQVLQPKGTGETHMPTEDV